MSRRGPARLQANTPPIVCRPALAAEQGAIVGGLERQLLAALGELGLDHGQRRAGAGRHHQLVGLVEA